MIHGLGTDIVEIHRIREMMDRHGERFLERCFTPGEIAYARRHKEDSIRFAGRWAAKEAVVKVLGTGFVKGISFHDIEVLPQHTGQPVARLSGGALEVADRLGITEVKVSISHSRDYAVATAIGVSGGD